MQVAGKDRLTRLIPLVAAIAVLIAAARPIVALVEALTARHGYPFDLEWMEGGQLVHAERLLRGEPIYQPCDHGFVPLPYPPVHFAALALAGALFGVDYASGRAVSIVALVVCMLLLAREVWKLSLDKISAESLSLLAVGSVAAGYPIVDGWFDLVRVDMLFAALVVAAAACAASVDDDRRAPYRGAAVGLLLTLAFFAKQTAAVYGPLLALMLWRRQRRAAVSMVATGALATAVALALLQWSTDGQYWTETIRVMAGHAWLKDLAVSATARLWVFIPYALVVPPLWLIAWRKRWLRSRSALWVGMFLVALPASVAASAKAAAHVNNLMMAVVLAGPVTIMIALDVARGLRRTRWHSVAIALGVALMGWCTFDWPMRFARYIPSPADWRAAASVNAVIASLPGDVVMPEHPFIPVRHGKGIDQPITQAYSDHMTLTGFAPLACFDATQASWAVLGTAPTPLVSGLVARQFELERSVGRAPNMRSGYRTRPRIVLRRRPSHQRQRAHTLFDFEDQSYRGWTREGDAFVTPLATTRAVLGTGGGHFASSWHRERGDAAQGRLTSPPFRIDRDYLGLTVGGGGSGVRVELWVGGKRVHLALGRDSFVMIPYIWDVRAHRGQLAELHVIDVSPHPWGHIHLDDVVMFDDGPQQLR